MKINKKEFTLRRQIKYKDEQKKNHYFMKNLLKCILILCGTLDLKEIKKYFY